MSEHRSAVFVPQPVAVRRLPPVKMHATLMAARAAPPMPSSFQSALPAVVPISESVHTSVVSPDAERRDEHWMRCTSIRSVQ
jgi:hypothetical protein